MKSLSGDSDVSILYASVCHDMENKARFAEKASSAIFRIEGIEMFVMVISIEALL